MKHFQTGNLIVDFVINPLLVFLAWKMHIVLDLFPSLFEKEGMSYIREAILLVTAFLVLIKVIIDIFRPRKKE